MHCPTRDVGKWESLPLFGGEGEPYQEVKCRGWDVENKKVDDDHVENPLDLPGVPDNKMEPGVEHEGLAGNLPRASALRDAVSGVLLARSVISSGLNYHAVPPEINHGLRDVVVFPDPEKPHYEP
jgi:hypothetical protein